MTKCYICGNEINEKNRSVEHILPNAIGGRLTSSKIICRDCNSKYGSNFDAELSRQLNFYANRLMIKRKRGNPPPVVMIDQKTGKKYSVDHEGIPSMEKPFVNMAKTDNELNFSVIARDMEEARKILTGFSKKFKNFDVEEILKQAEHVEEEILEPLHFTITVGGKESMLAILKIALNYYIGETGDIFSVTNAIEDLKNDKADKIEPIILIQRLYDLDEDEVSHGIYLRGSQVEHKLYAIIELFNAVQFVVKLSENYDLPDLEELYVFDVLLCSEKHKVIRYRPDYNFIFNFSYPSSNPNFQIYKDAASRIFSIAQKRQQSAHIDKMIRKAMDDTIGKMIPEGDIITREAAECFAKKLIEDFIKYYMRFRNPP